MMFERETEELEFKKSTAELGNYIERIGSNKTGYWKAK